MMKKLTAILTAAALILTSAIAFAGCSNKTESSDSSASSDKSTSAVSTSAEKLTIAIPNDTTNEARALLLLQELGYIKLKDGAGITATPK
ncbi:MAG: MetQ/NlpA family ABC transporter substrate-binding protein, partial [Ruminococcus sp.]